MVTMYTVEDLPELTNRLAGKLVAFDVETTGLHWWTDKVIGLGLSSEEAGVLGYLPLTNSKDRKAASKFIQKLPARELIAHNLKFECHFLDIPPHKLTAPYGDTTVIAHLIDSRQPKALGAVERAYLGTESKRAHVSQAPARTKIWDWPLDILSDYCANDCLVTEQLRVALGPQMDLLELWDIYEKEMVYLDVLWRAERRGIMVDGDILQHSIDTLKGWTASAEAELLQLVKDAPYSQWTDKFNWRSNVQLSKALYDWCGLEKPPNPYADDDGVDRSKFADKGKYNATATSTFIISEKVKHPWADLIAWLRELMKLTTVMEKWLTYRDSAGRVHTSFNMTGTRTGRLSTSDPSVQNLPGAIRARAYVLAYEGSQIGALRTDELNMRRALIATPGYKMVSIDHKQQEIRMFAILSREEKMLELARAGTDIHRQVAMLVYGESDEIHREWCKTIAFGLIYGMTIGSLHHRLGQSPLRSRQIAKQYWTTFPRILPWVQEMSAMCADYKMVRYWSGRIWREEDHKFFYRSANAVIQGGSADLLSVAAIRCDELLQRTGAGHLLSLIHDEMLFEVKEEMIDEIVPQLAALAEVPDLFDVPFFADPKVGESYGDTREYQPPAKGPAPKRRRSKGNILAVAGD